MHQLAFKYQLLETGPLVCACTGLLGGKDLPSLSDLGLTRAEIVFPLRLWAPWARGRVPPSESVSRDRSYILASLRVGEGAAGPAVSSPMGGGGRGLP